MTFCQSVKAHYRHKFDLEYHGELKETRLRKCQGGGGSSASLFTSTKIYEKGTVTWFVSFQLETLSLALSNSSIAQKCINFCGIRRRNISGGAK